MFLLLLLLLLLLLSLSLYLSFSFLFFLGGSTRLLRLCLDPPLFNVSDEQKAVFLVSVSDCSESDSYAGDLPTVTGCPVSNPGSNCANGLLSQVGAIKLQTGLPLFRPMWSSSVQCRHRSRHVAKASFIPHAWVTNTHKSKCSHFASPECSKTPVNR